MSVRHLQNQALRAAREGRSLEKWICEKDGLGAAYAVLTDAGIVYNIPIGKQVIIDKLCYGLRTSSDKMGIYLVSCTAVDGGGDVTQITHCFITETGATNLGKEQFSESFNPPICLKYSEGIRSVSMAALANDANAKIMVAWHGWFEDESTLS